MLVSSTWPSACAAARGTYIRSIARDLGETLEVGGHLVSLRRTVVGPFALDAARTLEELADGFELVPMEEVARASFAVVRPRRAAGRPTSGSAASWRSTSVTLVRWRCSRPEVSSSRSTSRTVSWPGPVAVFTG